MYIYIYVQQKHNLVEKQQLDEEEEADGHNPGLDPPVGCCIIPVEEVEEEVQEAELQGEVVVGS